MPIAKLVFVLKPFSAGEEPALLAARGADAVESLAQNMPGLRKKAILPGAGHWIQQEAPVEVNRLLLDFLSGK